MCWKIEILGILENSCILLLFFSFFFVVVYLLLNVGFMK
jgi:hypothetical protein